MHLSFLLFIYLNNISFQLNIVNIICRLSEEFVLLAINSIE